MTNEVNTQADDLTQGLFGIFGIAADQVQTTTDEDKGPSPYFNPDSASAPDKTYSAKIKFLPYISNPHKAYGEIQKYVINTGSSKIHYRSAKSLGKYENCPVAAKYWFLNGKEQADARLKAVGENISWKKSTYALIQVIEDYSKPENNGKILIWNVPSDILKLVEAERKPSAAQIRMNKTANNVFDPVVGRCLMLDIPIKSIAGKDGKPVDVRDYTRCSFVNESQSLTTMIVKGETTQRPVPADGTPEMLDLQKAIIATLTDKDTLKLADFDYKPESEENTNKALAAIDQMIALATGQAPAAPIQGQANIAAPQQNIAAPQAAPAQGQPIAAQQQAAPQPTAVQPTTTAEQASANVLDGIFNESV